MRFEIIRSRVPRRQRWRWRIVATNGRILAHSEAYTTEAGCRDAIKLVQDGARFAPTDSQGSPS